MASVSMLARSRALDTSSDNERARCRVCVFRTHPDVAASGCSFLTGSGRLALFSSKRQAFRLPTETHVKRPGQSFSQLGDEAPGVKDKSRLELDGMRNAALEKVEALRAEEGRLKQELEALKQQRLARQERQRQAALEREALASMLTERGGGTSLAVAVDSSDTAALPDASQPAVTIPGSLSTQGHEVLGVMMEPEPLSQPLQSPVASGSINSELSANAQGEAAQGSPTRGISASAPSSTSSAPSGTEREAAAASLAQLYEAHRGARFFTNPSPPVAGRPLTLYFNKTASWLGNVSSDRQWTLRGGFNDWEWEKLDVPLVKSDLPKDADAWVMCKLTPTKEVYDLQFVINDGGEGWDNNSGDNFKLQIVGGMTPGEFSDYVRAEQLKAELKKAEEEMRRAEAEAAARAEKERQEEERKKNEARNAAVKAEQIQAQKEVEAMLASAKTSLSRARPYLENVYYTEPVLAPVTDASASGKPAPKVPTAGNAMWLFYNRNARNLRSGDCYVRSGYNGWYYQKYVVYKMERAEEIDTRDGSWWFKAKVELPRDAFVADFVFHNADNGGQFDNNGMLDYHVAVAGGPTPEKFLQPELENWVTKLRTEREARWAEEERKVAARAEERRLMKQKAKDRQLALQRRVLYTEPTDVQAGQPVTVFYNPDATILNGRSEVYIRGSWNRWTHPSCFLPQKMTRTGEGNMLKATIDVPWNAYMMDFVFSDTGALTGGFYDNNRGMDYHIYVNNKVKKQPPLHVMHVAVEMAPIAKVGGLGDVVTSLGRAVREMGHNVEVILPKYNCVDYSHAKGLVQDKSFYLDNVEWKVWKAEVEGLPTIFLEPMSGLFWVGCIYGRNDDARRFGIFCDAAVEFVRSSGRQPNILHCHDWSTGPVAGIYWRKYHHNGLPNTRVVFTIHNMNYGAAQIADAMMNCQKATTVSPTYAREISGNPSIANNYDKFYGIVNGIDPEIWDPSSDLALPLHYTHVNVAEGKAAAREALRSRLGLAKDNVPIVAVISRLTAQKGIHLIKHAAFRTLDRGGQFVLLGSAPDGRVQNEFNALAGQLSAQNHHRCRMVFQYDEVLSRLIYAAADILVVPSMFEPCGLSQIIAMRYGTVPVVRRTGGLNDTVFDVDTDRQKAADLLMEPNGFVFDGSDALGLDYALNRAISAWWNDVNWFRQLQATVMQQDWTWNTPALDYVELYQNALKS